ncbi:MAG TPA: phosphoglycerate transporter [Ruminococcaceae bacterium]|nr:phosphoglycerate transporter [Oscillospiraceae bacterium]
MRIGIVGASENEINPFISVMSNTQTEEYAMLTFHKGKYAGIDIIALFCGVCKVNAAIATQILIDKYQVAQIIVVGVAGAIDTELHIGDTIISSEIAYHDVADEILTQYHPWMKSIYFTAAENIVHGIIKANADDHSVMVGRIVTGEAFIDQEGRKEIIEKYNPLCVDMETASIAHVCYVNSIPIAAIRSMSDTPHESGNSAFERYGKAAAEKSVRVLIRYLNQIAAR